MLRELRRHIGLTQEVVGARMGKPQSVVSRLERQHDWLLSTVEQYVTAAGGRLRLRVEFDGEVIDLDRVPVR